MNTDHAFSIVMPVLNGIRWIPDAVRSVLDHQKATTVELIVLDGGSNDGTREWLTTHVGPRATLVFEADRGQTDALIRGFKLAKCEYLGWLNADDVLEPDALETVARVLRAHEDVMAVSGLCATMDADGNALTVPPLPPSGSLVDLLNYPFNLAQPATFFRATAYEAVGGLDPSLDLAMDVDLWMKLAQLTPIALLPNHLLARARIHQDAKSVSRSYECLREVFGVRRKHGLRRGSRTWWYHIVHGYVSWAVKLRWLRQ